MYYNMTDEFPYIKVCNNCQKVLYHSKLNPVIYDTKIKLCYYCEKILYFKNNKFDIKYKNVSLQPINFPLKKIEINIIK